MPIKGEDRLGESVFTALARARIALRRTERLSRAWRARLEQELIDAAGGVKNLGPSIIDQTRFFEVKLAEDENLIAWDEQIQQLLDMVELHKAAVREYECEAGARLAVFHD